MLDFFSPQYCGWGSPRVLQEWPDGGPRPEGAGQSLSWACGVLGCLVTDFGCVKSWQRQPVPCPPALRGGPFPHTGARTSACTLSLHPRSLSCSEMVLWTPTCEDQGVLRPREPPATPGLVGLSLHCADLCGHSTTWGGAPCPLHPRPHGDSHPPSFHGHLEVIRRIPRCPGTAAASASGRGERTSVFSE